MMRAHADEQWGNCASSLLWRVLYLHRQWVPWCYWKDREAESRELAARSAWCSINFLDAVGTRRRHSITLNALTHFTGRESSSSSSGGGNIASATAHTPLLLPAAAPARESDAKATLSTRVSIKCILHRLERSALAFWLEGRALQICQQRGSSYLYFTSRCTLECGSRDWCIGSESFRVCMVFEISCERLRCRNWNFLGKKQNKEDTQDRIGENLVWKMIEFLGKYKK